MNKDDFKREYYGEWETDTSHKANFKRVCNANTKEIAAELTSLYTSNKELKDKAACWDLVLKLTANELNSVKIIHDNADFTKHNCCVVVSWWSVNLKKQVEIECFGDTKLDCLTKALELIKSGVFG